MHIDEIREENYEIVQGYFIKRPRCENEGQKGVFITWRDFNLGCENFYLGKNLEFVIVMILLDIIMLNKDIY